MSKKKLSEVKSLLHSCPPNENIPVGLEIGLPSHRMETKERYTCTSLRENGGPDFLVKEDPNCGNNIGNGKLDMVENKQEREELLYTISDLSGSLCDEEASLHTNGKVQEVISLETSSMSCLMDESRICLKTENVNFAKAKYRFHSQRRQSSFLAISRKDYHLMT